MQSRIRNLSSLVVLALGMAGIPCNAAGNPQQDFRDAVDSIIQPIMEEYHVPGMAVGVVVGGETHLFAYGVASTKTGKPVAHDTLFELGSISKTLTATLASYAQANNHLSFSDKVSIYLPKLRDSAFGEVSLVQLATHTAGGLPLQVPDDIGNTDQLMLYLKQWQPTYVPGTYRVYTNPGIGMLGWITAEAMGDDFVFLMERRLFPALGMRQSFIHVPESRMVDYAQGYTKDNTPIRMQAGVLSSEAYGIKSTVADMLRFLQANMELIELDDTFQRAVMDTHRGYFKAGKVTQALIWESYPWPTTLEALLEGNGQEMIFNPVPVTAVMQGEENKSIWINKTGSTNGFGAYIAFVPEDKLGIVILANKNFPIPERVTAAYGILKRADKKR